MGDEWRVKPGFRIRLRREPSVNSSLVPDGLGFAVLEAGDVFSVTSTREVLDSASTSQLYLEVARAGAFAGWAFGASRHYFDELLTLTLGPISVPSVIADRGVQSTELIDKRFKGHSDFTPNLTLSTAEAL